MLAVSETSQAQFVIIFVIYNHTISQTPNSSALSIIITKNQKQMYEKINIIFVTI